MLRNFLVWLFATEGKPGEIAWLNIWHILYVLIIFGSTFVLGWYISKKDKEAKEKLLRTLACATVLVYVIDFFIQPLMDGGAGVMNVDKLPFHICTVLCPVLAFVQFNKRFERFSEPVAFLAMVGPMMYLVYPGGAIGDISPFCYKIIQTFVYHGLVFSWGFNMIATGRVKPSIKRGWWRALIGLLLVALWATLGNLSHNSNVDGDPHYDWFFLTGSTFPFVPKALMPLAVIVAVFSATMALYGVYYAVIAVKHRLSENDAEREQARV
jgi:hypothetical protein